MSWTGEGRTPEGIDLQRLRTTLLELLGIPSPAGRTDEVIQVIGDRLVEIGLKPEVTRRGAILVKPAGMPTEGPARALVAHADTIGMIVREVKPNGRLRVAQIGTHSARFAEGARVTIFTDEPDTTYTGTVLPLKASGHRWGDEVDTQGVGWEQVEVRIDERVASAEDVRALGIEVGDHVAFHAQPVITPSGFVVSRHLDDKAALAALLEMLAVLREQELEVALPVHVLITVTEEVGHGASHGLDRDVAELLSLDTAVVAPGQTSVEDAVTIVMQDSHGPFDYHLARRLCALCAKYDIPYRRDVFDHYRSDAASALEAGAATRAGLVGVGVDATHGHERTHMDGIVALCRLLIAYTTSPLTFTDWDSTPVGTLQDFPSTSVQPAPHQPEMPQ
ncbi:MAG TPA: osmoprotectant NAGGN system M42 family peptidase [Microthrixaceae bacterium]|nr:osmoprotectant NAGGN system M42 family peptidase [Microthrixaceae bacterium]